MDKYLTYKDLPICEKDFRRVGHVCSVCDDIILDRVCMVEGVVMCEKDYMELVATWPCSACGKDIPTDSHAALMVGDVRFHHDCLKCSVCEEKLDGKMVTLDKENKPYCTKDYDRSVRLIIVIRDRLFSSKNWLNNFDNPAESSLCAVEPASCPSSLRKVKPRLPGSELWGETITSTASSARTAI